jgi:hypothetical protein
MTCRWLADNSLTSRLANSPRLMISWPLTNEWSTLNGPHMIRAGMIMGDVLPVALGQSTALGSFIAAE